jgi:hypothetical protein
VPRTIAEMARDFIAFTDALDLTWIDLLGFSIGGMIAQEQFAALVDSFLGGGAGVDRVA